MYAHAIQERRSTLALLATATAIGALGLAAGGTAGALLAEDMTGSTSWAGVPLGVLVVGSAVGALVISYETSRVGRARALVIGYGLGGVGAGLVVAAVEVDHFGLLLAGSAALGVGNAAIFLTRYAAAEVGVESSRGRAIGAVLFATALGAVISPNLLGPSGDVASALGLGSLSGLYVVAVIAFGAAATLLAAIPRPALPLKTSDWSRAEVRVGLRSGRLALFVLGATNFVMVAVMAIAPIHLVEHGHTRNFVGVVISIHVLCMFAPSPVTGWLADRAGSLTVAAVGALLLIAAGVSGALLDLSHGAAMTLMLVLLGLGWNAGVVGGSTLLAASVPAALRPQAEGIGEVAMGLAAGAGAPIAGLIVAFGNIASLTLVGAGVGVLILATLFSGRYGGGRIRTSVG